MNAYTDFAEVYDAFMDNIPYDEWYSYLRSILKKYPANNKLALDLGCGTGNLTTRMAADGYDMIGIDNSFEMLSIAREKSMDAEPSILYLNQDMRDFELYGTVGTIISICDSMNYMTTDEDFLSVLKLANNYLDPSGIFVFDLKTPYFFNEEVGNRTIAEDRGEISFIWNNDYDQDTRINQYDLTIYLQEDEDLYRRFDETHFQRGYSSQDVKSLVEQSGLILLEIYDAFTFKPANENSTRIYVIAQENGKKNR